MIPATVYRIISPEVLRVAQETAYRRASTRATDALRDTTNDNLEARALGSQVGVRATRGAVHRISDSSSSTPISKTHTHLNKSLFLSPQKSRYALTASAW